MIAKRIDKDPKIKDSFRKLAEYLVAGDDGEKLEHLWMVNCWELDVKDDFDLAIDGIENTQALNQRVEGAKTYHLMVSFASGERPTNAQLEEMEREYAKALGFEEHSRICAAHQNTQNFHFHVAYNRIHPETRRAHSPFQDFRKLEAVTREMEKRFGLKVDLGMSDYGDRVGRQSDKGRNYEARTLEESFETFVLNQKDGILKDVDQSRNWQDLHKALAKRALGLKLRGNGIVFYSQGDDAKGESVKASLIDRTLSKPRLEKKFGPFQAPEKDLKRAPRSKQYRARPLTKDRRQWRLWRRYTGARRALPYQRTLSQRAWHLYLISQLTTDPLAIVLIESYRGFLSSAEKETAQAIDAVQKLVQASYKATSKAVTDEAINSATRRVANWLLKDRQFARKPEHSKASDKSIHID